MLNPALSLRQGDGWTLIYERLNPPQIDRYLGHRESIEKIVAFQAEYARNPDAAWEGLDDQFVEADPALDETPDRPGGTASA